VVESPIIKRALSLQRTTPVKITASRSSMGGNATIDTAANAYCTVLQNFMY
jgi:hypothetical protein